MEKSVISLKNISKSYGNDVVIDNLSLDIYPGEFLTLLGPSGCGKTTLLRLIAGLESSDSGEIFIDGILHNDIPANNRNVNTVFQNYALFPHMSVFNNVAFGLKLKKLPKQIIAENVTAILNMVKLKGFENRSVQRLSGGQKQRVAIARALVNKPLILLLDEPLSALDFKLRKQMQIELRQLHRKLGITFIFVTHDQEEALTMSDRIVVINEGKIEQKGTPIEIYETPNNMFVAKFVGEINALNGKVISTAPKVIEIIIEGITIKCKKNKDFRPGDELQFLLRPEDMRACPFSNDCVKPFLPGRVDELIYKGTTVDLLITLDSGKQILITEFFNEDAEEISYSAGEKVCVTWYDGWEVILPYEK